MELAEIVLVDDGPPKYRQLADRIEEMIRREQLAPAFRIPSERQLAKQLGVSVITVNSAMTELMNRKLVERRVGSGTYVCGPDASGARLRRIGFFRHGQGQVSPNDRYMGGILGTLLSYWQNTPYDFIAMRRDPDSYRATIREYGLDGILIYSPREEFIPAIRQLRNEGFPVVALSSIQPEIADISFGYSNEALLRDAVEALAGLGHRDIAFLIPDQNEAAYRNRHRGFLDAMWKARLPINPAWCEPLRDRDEGIRAILSGDSRPSAVILGSCGYGPAFYRAAAECAMTVPRDVSVLSIDEDDALLALRPAPSAFRIDVVRLTLEASDALLRMIEHREVIHEETRNYSYIDRGTCLALK